MSLLEQVKRAYDLDRAKQLYYSLTRVHEMALEAGQDEVRHHLAKAIYVAGEHLRTLEQEAAGT